MNCNGNAVMIKVNNSVNGCDEKSDIYYRWNCHEAYTTTIPTSLSTESLSQKSNKEKLNYSVINISTIIGFICV